MLKDGATRSRSRTWDLALGTEVSVRDLALTPADRVNLVRRHPELFPSWVGESLDGLTG